MTAPTIRTLSTREVYRNPWLSVREDRIELPDGSEGLYSVVDRPDFALVIAEQDGGFHVVDQFRYATQARHWEFPQGCFPPGRTGSPAELAAAELREETGITARTWTELGTFEAWHGASGQLCTAFHATDLHHAEPEREPGEQDMRQRWLPRAEFEAEVSAGSIRDDSTLAAYLLLCLRERRTG